MLRGLSALVAQAKETGSCRLLSKRPGDDGGSKSDPSSQSMNELKHALV